MHFLPWSELAAEGDVLAGGSCPWLQLEEAKEDKGRDREETKENEAWT